MRTTSVKQSVDRAAVELFAARGVDGVSIADIASAAGASQGALYRHYRSKDALAAQLFTEAYLRTGAELAAIRHEKRGFAPRLAAMIAHFCALYDHDSALVPLPADCPAQPPAAGRRSRERASGGHRSDLGRCGGRRARSPPCIRRPRRQRSWGSYCKPRSSTSTAGSAGRYCRAHRRWPKPRWLRLRRWRSSQ